MRIKSVILAQQMPLVDKVEDAISLLKTAIVPSRLVMRIPAQSLNQFAWSLKMKLPLVCPCVTRQMIAEMDTIVIPQRQAKVFVGINLKCDVYLFDLFNY